MWIFRNGLKFSRVLEKEIVHLDKTGKAWRSARNEKRLDSIHLYKFTVLFSVVWRQQQQRRWWWWWWIFFFSTLHMKDVSDVGCEQGGLKWPFANIQMRKTTMVDEFHDFHLYISNRILCWPKPNTHERKKIKRTFRKKKNIPIEINIYIYIRAK